MASVSNGFYGMNIDNFYTDAFRFQDLACFDSFPNHMAAGKNGNIVTFRKLLALPITKSSSFVKMGQPVGQNAGKPALRNRQWLSWRLWFGYNRRNDNRHTRQHFHHTDIFQYLVRCAVFPKGKPGMGSTDLYIFSAIGNTLPDLVIHTAGRKIGKSGGEKEFYRRW